MLKVNRLTRSSVCKSPVSHCRLKKSHYSYKVRKLFAVAPQDPLSKTQKRCLSPLKKKTCVHLFKYFKHKPIHLSHNCFCEEWFIFLRIKKFLISWTATFLHLLNSYNKIFSLVYLSVQRKGAKKGNVLLECTYFTYILL